MTTTADSPRLPLETWRRARRRSLGNLTTVPIACFPPPVRLRSADPTHQPAHQE